MQALSNTIQLRLRSAPFGIRSGKFLHILHPVDTMAEQAAQHIIPVEKNADEEYNTGTLRYWDYFSMRDTVAKNKLVILITVSKNNNERMVDDHE
jgi:hypothetical protein